MRVIDTYLAAIPTSNPSFPRFLMAELPDTDGNCAWTSTGHPVEAHRFASLSDAELAITEVEHAGFVVRFRFSLVRV